MNFDLINDLPRTANKRICISDQVSNHVWQISDLLLVFISAIRYAHGALFLTEIQQINMKFYDFHNDVNVSDGSTIGEDTLLIQKS